MVLQMKAMPSYHVSKHVFDQVNLIVLEAVVVLPLDQVCTGVGMWRFQLDP